MNDRLVTALEALPREAWETQEPPPLVLPESARPARVGRVRRWRARVSPPALTLRPAVAAGVAAALVAVGGVAGVLAGRAGDDGGGETARRASLARIGVGAPGATGTVAIKGRTAEIDVARLAPSRRGDFYEVWLLTPPGRLVSLGSFRVPQSGQAKVRVPLPADPRGYEFFDISVEPDDGNPGHSSKSVLRGRTL